MKPIHQAGATLIVLLAAFAGRIAPAHARIDEVRVGVVHNVRLDHGDIVDGKEDGENVEVEIISSSPDFLNLIGSPRPYVVGSLNTGDGVSFAGAGVIWRWEFADGWAFEPGFGYIVHDGEVDNIYAPGTPEATAFEAENQLLGSEDLFRTTLALEREFSPRLAAQIYYEHMSHGQVLDQGRNQGLDFVGMRLLYRFDTDAAE
jgi:lipid A 3-O-deacylase